MRGCKGRSGGKLCPCSWTRVDGNVLELDLEESGPVRSFAGLGQASCYFSSTEVKVQC